MSSINRHDRAPGASTPARAPETRARPASADEQQLVPAWLAALVLVLLLAVMGVGGYVIRGFVTGQGKALTPQQVDVGQWSARVKKNPTDPQAHLGLGYAYETAGQYSKSLAEYDAVLKIDPREPAAYYNRGVVYLKLGKGKLAEQSWWQSLAIDKTQALAAKALGEYYASKKEYKSLLVAVQPAVDAHPEMADLQYLTGLANERLGNKAIAVQRYRLALKYSPDMVEARGGLARLGVTAP